MDINNLLSCLERTPVIAAVNDSDFEDALHSPAEVIFHLNANLLRVADCIASAHGEGKCIFIHLDLAEGLRQDKTTIEYLTRLNADGIISTKAQLIKAARDKGMLAVQRFFALDSKGLSGIGDIISASRPDLIEIMPGIASKVIKRFADVNIPVIAGGLIETKSEVTEALSNGAFAVSTGKKELWYL